MDYRELGATGVLIPEVGLGAWEYRGGIPPLQRGIDLGASLIDTAEIYGTEEVVGEAIAGRREHVFLATKVSGDHLKYDQVLRAADASLRRLRTEVIDLYQVHWPNPRVPIADTMRAMETLADAGKVRFIGVSNFTPAELQEAQSCLSRHAIVANQIEYSLLHRRIEADLPFYQRHHITVIAYSPLARGDLFSSRPRRGLDLLRAVAQESGRTVAQVALNWCLSRPGVVTIPKTDHLARVDELCGASGWRLSPEQVATLDRAFS